MSALSIALSLTLSDGSSNRTLDYTARCSLHMLLLLLLFCRHQHLSTISSSISGTKRLRAQFSTPLVCLLSADIVNEVVYMQHSSSVSGMVTIRWHCFFCSSFLPSRAYFAVIP